MTAYPPPGPDDPHAALIAAIEPVAIGTSPMSAAATFAASQAVSLKRIADALDKLTAPPASKALTAEQRAAAESYVFPWQDWPGGELPPVPGDIRVEVKFRDGTVAAGLKAMHWQWHHTDHPRHIIAWRLAK